MRIRFALVAVVGLTCFAWPASAGPFAGPPKGYTLVADDDCGKEDAAHVLRGKAWTYPPTMLGADLSTRDLIFDNDFCVLRYKKPNPAARYQVDVVYVTETGSGRRQRLEANGHIVHAEIALPVGKAGRFLYEIPPAAYAKGGNLDLKFIRTGPANATVCRVRIWSTDPRPLGGMGATWPANGPVEADWARQDALRGKPTFSDWADPAKEVARTVVPCIDEQLARGRAILADLDRLYATDLAASREELQQAAAARDDLRKAASLDPAAWLKVYLQARWTVRRLAFKNPLLPSGRLLFVRRHHAHAMHQCSRRLGIFTKPGGGICVLEGLSADGEGKVTCLTEGKFPRGTFSRPDVSADGRRIVFGFAPEREETDKHKQYGYISQDTADLFATHQVGLCHAFQVYEMNADGSGRPRKLTQGPCENSDPFYLPDGRIAFMSHSPGGRVQCGDWALAYCVFSMKPDGSDVRQITRSKDGEWDPFLLEDGTIGFTRWEYVMKFWSPIQMIWSVRPDGTNPRLIYGSDLRRHYAYPLNYAAGRQIPGTGKIVCIGSAHHNTGAGPVCVVDTDLGRNTAEGLRRITPVRFVETPDRTPPAGWYDCPWPLTENHFLVSYSFRRNETDTTGYGLYLLDAYGGKELLHRDAELSALYPMPLAPRPARSVVSTADQAGAPPRATPAFGEFLIRDVHQGLPESMRGLARYVRVVEVHERKIHTRPYDVQVGPDSGFETKTVLGLAPVEADGSAYFRVPAETSVFFSVLDADFRALHTMRSVTDLRAGERTGCVGCHQPGRVAPGNRAVQAVRREASVLAPPPWGTAPMDYAALIQPLLDRRCTSCHDGTKAKTQADKKSFDLTARQVRPFMNMRIPHSYYNLRKYVRHAPIHTYFLAPGTFGSRVSGLPAVLAKGHYNVKLPPAEIRLLCAWIDCNAPYLGHYEQVADKGH